MRRWMVLPLAFLMAAPASLAAQEGDSPTWWAVFTEQVAPENVAAFEEASAKMHEVIVANAPEGMVYYTHASPEMGYSYGIPMSGMADFMDMNAQWMGMVDQIGWENWEAMSADHLVENRTMNFYVELPDLSYHPAGYAESLADKPVRHFDWLYPKPGMETEFNEVMMEWVALYEEMGIESGWTAYQAVSGDDLPLIVLITPATSASAYYLMSEEIDASMGEKGQDLMMRSMALMRKFEHEEAQFRPDLSVMPE